MELRVDLYQHLIRPLLFSKFLHLDPERLHNRLLDSLGWLSDEYQAPIGLLLRGILRQWCCVTDPRLTQTLWGLQFPNPLGLAAGFDKDGLGTRIWPDLGFGFAELGTVTCQAQPGNPQPRLFRLPRDRAVINRMGFNNQGSAALAERLQQVYSQLAQELQQVEYRSDPQDSMTGQLWPIPLGINLGKSKVTPLTDAAADYCESFRRLQHLGSYFVINVSSPNTPGLRSLQTAAALDPILAALQAENKFTKPLLLKIAPDLDWQAIGAILELVAKHQLNGIIATNTTIERPPNLQTRTLRGTSETPQQAAGGLSGAPLRSRSTDIIRFIWEQTQGRLPIIGVGGIFTVADAWEKLLAGASLLQTYTGWVYRGPSLTERITRGLQQRLNHHGVDQLTAVVGQQNL